MPDTINRLNGPDTPGQDYMINAAYSGSLSGADATDAYISLHATTASASYRSSLSGANDHLIATSEHGALTHTAASAIVGVPRTLASSAPGYYFNGYVPEDVMHRYLDRAVTMAGLSNQFINNGPSRPADTGFTGPPQYPEDMAMLQDIGAKFIGRMVYFWGNIIYLDTVLTMLAGDIVAIHAYDNDVICQGFLCEQVDDTCRGYVVPQYVLDAFGIIAHLNHLGEIDPSFDYLSMLYPTSSPYYSQNQPDITQTETQLWYYFLATQYINAGCEALTFGDNLYWNDISDGMSQFWSLLYKIRQYAATVARNGVVLCDARLPPSPYYDPPGRPVLPDWQRQLLFDFFSLGVYYNRPANWASLCTDISQPLQLEPGISGTLISNTPCGSSPQGWYTSRSPYLLEFDNGGGCANLYNCSVSPASANQLDLYDCDNITWFARQGIPPDFSVYPAYLLYHKMPGSLWPPPNALSAHYHIGRRHR